MDAVIAGVGALMGFAALHFANENLMKKNDLSCLCPPLGAVAVLLFCMPGAPASQPKAVIGGHLVAGCVAYAVVQSGVDYPEAISVALTISLMTALKVVHPPAGAYAFFFANKKMTEKGILAPGLAGAVILVGVQLVFNQIKKVVAGKKSKKD